MVSTLFDLYMYAWDWSSLFQTEFIGKPPQPSCVAFIICVGMSFFRVQVSPFLHGSCSFCGFLSLRGPSFVRSRDPHEWNWKLLLATNSITSPRCGNAPR
ncbi:hypothetical protein VNO77_03415 [Canavalia gladiata]|uniref:Uncharacterized protein n=1 Tax=Canavalia gladiata TaxID=3824 RepID=A0AAN9MWP6_CANGL